MIRLGFIGAGGYGRVQIDGFLALQAQGLVKIVALADPAPGVLKALGELPGLKTVSSFLDYRDLLALKDLDAVVISAPIPLHEEITLAALDRQLFILLEKPPVPLLSQLERLIAADTNGHVMVAFQHIYSDLIRRLKRELVSGRLGKILSISAHGVWPRHTGYYQRSSWAGQTVWSGKPVLDGPCTNAFAHFVNIALYLASPREGGFAMPVQVVGEVYRARPGLQSYDTGCLTGILENDIRVFVGFSHTAPQAHPVQVDIQGVEGKLRLLDDGETLQSEDGQVIRGDDGRENLRRAFLAFAGGDSSQNKTSLDAMRGYVLATNLMFTSSNGIHQIPGQYVHSLKEGSENAIFVVDGIADHLAQSAGQLLPLCKTSVPWARKTPVVLAAKFSDAEIAQIFQLFDSANEATNAGLMPTQR